PEFDTLFLKMKNMPNGPERLAVIKQMLEIVRNDSPWVWGYHPESLVLLHNWVSPQKINAIYSDTLKYMRIDPKERAKQRLLWNKPIVWPIYVFFGLLMLLIIPVIVRYWKKEHKPH
ncbi:MAG: peptide ABC transporter substrate-binding protein, partial [Proteobacteria bacterium]|nr:peptide ABC transporter substrate-binding protein [Pseudomonadota bacterium]